MEIKNKRFQFMLTPTEFERLHKLAEKRGVSAASLLRAAIRRMGKK